jgi:hypothetical protein
MTAGGRRILNEASEQTMVIVKSDIFSADAIGPATTDDPAPDGREKNLKDVEERGKACTFSPSKFLPLSTRIAYLGAWNRALVHRKYFVLFPL